MPDKEKFDTLDILLKICQECREKNPFENGCENCSYLTELTILFNDDLIDKEALKEDWDIEF